MLSKILFTVFIGFIFLGGGGRIRDLVDSATTSQSFLDFYLQLLKTGLLDGVFPVLIDLAAIARTLSVMRSEEISARQRL